MNMVDLQLQLMVVRQHIHVITTIAKVIAQILILPLLAAIATLGRIAALRTCVSTNRLPPRTGALVPLYPLFKIPKKNLLRRFFDRGVPRGDEVPPWEKIKMITPCGVIILILRNRFLDNYFLFHT